MSEDEDENENEKRCENKGRLSRPSSLILEVVLCLKVCGA